MNENSKQHAVVLGGSRGIGNAITQCLLKLDYNVEALSSTELDTSNIEQVNTFATRNIPLDILVLNTGGPPAKNFFEIDIDLWNKYYHQLFLSFTIILQKSVINQNGYVFLISSINVKEPNESLTLSQAFRSAFSSIFEVYSRLVASKRITCVNIMPGSIKTDRLVTLVDDLDSFEKGLIHKYAGDPLEIGQFISSIVSQNITYINGASISFDGGNNSTFP